MTKNLKYFLTFLFLSFVGWWGVNILTENLEEFFYWQQFVSNPQILAAQASQIEFDNSVRNSKPLKKNEAADLTINAKSAMAIFLDNRGNERILFQQNPDEKLPIASLTKLMTAKIVLDNYDLSQPVNVSKKAIDQEENLGKLRVGETLSVQDLLYPLLMESSNDAAFALANDYPGMTEEKFIQLMNGEAERLGLSNTYFVDISGLDPEEPVSATNYSSAVDLAKLAQELLKTSLIWEILSRPQINLYGQELKNTNKLLTTLSGIVGGKTGYTEKALGCFLLVIKAPQEKGLLINVILGADNRFEEMEKLINWLETSYLW